VTEHSDALSLDKGVFTSRDPKRIAASLKRSAERSSRRKSSPFRSALSMLTFYINQPSGQEPACLPQKDVDAGEGRAAQAIRQGLRDPRQVGRVTRAAPLVRKGRAAGHPGVATSRVAPRRDVGRTRGDLFHLPIIV